MLGNATERRSGGEEVETGIWLFGERESQVVKDGDPFFAAADEGIWGSGLMNAQDRLKYSGRRWLQGQQAAVEKVQHGYELLGQGDAEKERETTPSDGSVVQPSIVGKKGVEKVQSGLPERSTVDGDGLLFDQIDFLPFGSTWSAIAVEEARGAIDRTGDEDK